MCSITYTTYLTILKVFRKGLNTVVFHLSRSHKRIYYANWKADSGRKNVATVYLPVCMFPVVCVFQSIKITKSIEAHEKPKLFAKGYARKRYIG